jgi:hypothetical protein
VVMSEEEMEAAIAVEEVGVGERHSRKLYPKDGVEEIELDRCFSDPILKTS